MRCIIHAPATNSLNPRNRNSEYRFESHRGNLESFRPRNTPGLGVCTYNYLDATQLKLLTATVPLSLSLSLLRSLFVSVSFSLVDYLRANRVSHGYSSSFPRGKIGSFFRFSQLAFVVLVLQSLNQELNEFLWPTMKDRVVCLERYFSFLRIGFRVFGEGSEGDYPFLGFISYGQSEKGTLWQGLERIIDFVSGSNEEIINIFLSM